MQWPYPTLPSTSRRLGRLRPRFSGKTEQFSHAIEPLGGFAGYFRTRGQHAADNLQAGTPLVFARRKQFGYGGEARRGLQQQHEELLTHDLLELRERQTRACVVGASPPQCLQAPLVDHPPRTSDIEQAANDAFPETAAADLRLELGDARLQTLAVFR